MKATKRKKLEAAGWKIGSAREFLNLSDEEAALVETQEDEEVVEALRRNAEIEGDPNQAISLAQLDSQIQSRRELVRPADDRK